ncbi:L-serine ammonia-lyase, iron-sulfur-dependent, subunit alpha [Ruminococcaceae bacterium OttesenSCG-928-L11]|nr:L-serine ammonia-lyase, iron-sulfur-dependent, subunit alpha [Ruminococcaceae bacterium OttesenSCG-928-L11]
MDFRTAAQLIECCTQQHIPLWEAMLRREMALFDGDRDAIIARMAHSWQIMKQSVRDSLAGDRKSMGGLIGGEAARLTSRLQAGSAISGTVSAKASAYAMGVLEVNASMGLIVAAPTAGSSGVLPGVLLALQKEHSLDDNKIVEALFTAAAIGYLIMRNATVAGAQGGCQAEVGAASAMAAGAAAELMGAPPDQCLAASSMALANLLGLVCDPVAGLVEAPCQKRNAAGAANALICAEMALAGITERIPFDEMVEAMLQVGNRIPAELRETSLGGMAATPTACALCQGILGGQ